MYQHVHYRMQSIDVNLQLSSRFFSYTVIFWVDASQIPKEKKHDSIGRNSGMFGFDSIVLVPYEFLNLKSSQG